MLSSNSLYVWFLLTYYQCIFELWSGVLLSKNAALQLLLIIDLIFDWARDMVSHLSLRSTSSFIVSLGGGRDLSPSKTWLLILKLY